MSTKKKKVLSLFLALVMVFSLLPGAAFASQKDDAGGAEDDFMKIVFLDCGRKYFSVESIKKIIDNAAAAGFNYIQLAVGNDGLRFLLDDMSLTVNGTTYESSAVSAAIHTGNESYYNFTTDELTQSEMDTIITYAKDKGLGVIPCVNTPGHMDAILSAATSLTGTNCSYNNSARTIDVTNTTAVAFTQALLQKYIDYFKDKCAYFNMGADEYANDIYTTGSMGFGNLQCTDKYSSYVTYVNQVATLIKNANMTPMAFNDGIYFNNVTSSGTFDTDIVVCYWSSGWTGYTPMSAAALKSEGFKLVNTHGDYYWVLGKSWWQCDDTKASGFKYTSFQAASGQDGTIDDPSGAMFCIWCDYPGAGTEASVINSTAATIAAFGATLPTKSATVKDASTSVSVTAPGLTSVTGTKLTENVPTIAGAAEGKVVAYDITPSTASGSYTGSATVTLPIPEGWDTSKIRGYVAASANGEAQADIKGTVAGNAFTFTVPHFSVAAIYEADEAGSGTTTTTQEPIELTVGESKTVTQAGVDNTSKVNRDNLNTNIATVDVSYGNTTQTTTTRGDKLTSFTTSGTTGVISDGTNYLVVDSNGNRSSTTDVSQATQFTVTESNSGGGSSRYTIKVTDANRYLAVSDNVLVTTTSAGQGTSWTFDSSTGFYRTSGGGGGARYLVYSNDAWTVSTSATNSGFLYAVTTTTTTGHATTITFTGKSEGTTTVTVGNVTYNITVTDTAPSDAMTKTSITLEYWITNLRVYTSASPSSAYSKTINSSAANTTDGVAIADLVPAAPLYSNSDGWKAVYYWQAMRLDSSHQQTTDEKDDETANGTKLTHIRYYNGAWQYKTTDGAWKWFLSTDQFVAYYLQKTDVTKEITTYVKDWGYSTSSQTANTSGGKGQVALTVAVVYPDGTVSPTENNMYANSTTIFNYWSGRDIGIVSPANNSDYIISKITVTNGSRKANASANVWYNTDSINWTKKLQADKKTYWYDETVVWDKVTNANTTPMVNGATSNITWSAKNTAKLVLIYLETIKKDTNLNLVYYDRTGETEIARTQIAMTYDQGSTAPTYTSALKNGDEVIGGTKSWPGKTTSDNDYLPDTAYVTNSSGVNQTFNKALATVAIDGINEVYKTGLYKYDGAAISDNDKTLTLYYVKDTSKVTKTYVVDYGLPLSIPASEFIENSDKLTDVTATGAQFGDVEVTNQTLTYTPTKILTAEETITLTATFEGGAKETFTIGILPATTTYYEENFVDFNNGVNLSGDAAWTSAGGTQPTGVTQALEELGKHTNVYGYDKAYDSNKEYAYSMNTAKQVTVKSDSWTASSTSWPTATFTFKGTGFDVISLTNNTSGAIFVRVYEGSSASGTLVKDVMVDNYYGYTYDSTTKTWTVNTDAADTLYQIPVMKISGLAYKEYTAVITVAYSSYFDDANKDQYSFWLDAIRIYDPMGTNVETYVQDNEGYPVYTNLHKALINNDATINNQGLFIDGKSGATLDEYTNYGPNNEVYLQNGQAISFKLTGDLSKIASVQIGAKAPQGTDKGATMVVNSASTGTSITTATDMYYDITSVAMSNGAANTVTISNTGTGILSLTNLKITFKEQGTATLDTMTTENINTALMVVRSVFAAEAPVIEPFVPERFEAKWDRSVRAGQRATLTVKTSEDVAAISVDGQTIDTYRTYTERSGRGWHAARVTYRVFTYTVTPTVTTDYTVSALNSDGVASTPVTATLTVTTQRPGGWWGWWY